MAPLRIVVSIATAGRPKILKQTVSHLVNQTRAPDRVYVCAPASCDVLGSENGAVPISLSLGVRGSCIQRNLLIEAAADADIMLFLDDDFVTQNDYLEHLEAVFLDHPDVVLATGEVLADGILGPGLSFHEADELLKKDWETSFGRDGIHDVYNGYGCNMAVRMSPLREHAIRFDENLPLYGWLEDVDFSRRLAPYGRIVRADGMRGVHLGVKTGRQPGRRIGYSQIANPVYLARKGTLSWRRAVTQMGRNVAANLAHALKPEAYVDRRGRLSGHAAALVDLAMGRLSPTRIPEL